MGMNWKATSKLSGSGMNGAEAGVKSLFHIHAVDTLGSAIPTCHDFDDLARANLGGSCESLKSTCGSNAAVSKLCPATCSSCATWLLAQDDAAAVTAVKAKSSHPSTCAGAKAGHATSELYEILCPATFVSGTEKFKKHGLLGSINVKIAGGKAAASEISANPVANIYDVTVVYPHIGDYNVTVKITTQAGEVSENTFSVSVTDASPRKVVTHGSKPKAVLGAAAAAHDAAPDYNVYLMGGAAEDGSYVSDTWKLTTGMDSPAGLFSYRKKVDVSFAKAGSVVELKTDFDSLIKSGNMRSDCADVVLYDEDGVAAKFWIEPAGTPHGCGSATGTILWIETTASSLTKGLYLYYGNVDHTTKLSTSSIFTMFEDFESASLDAAWTIDSSSTDTCEPLKPGDVGSLASFTVTSDISLTGSQSLRANAQTMVGGTISRSATAPSGTGYVLKGFLFDTAYSGEHFMSPDFTACTADTTDSDKALLPTKNGVGVYSTSSNVSYSHTYPWLSTPVTRTKGWHSMAFYDDGSMLSVVVDDNHESKDVMKKAKSSLSKVLIRAGAFVDQSVGSTMYWDAIFVAPYQSSAAKAGDEEAVMFSPGVTAWSSVGTTNPPPARQGHSAVVSGGKAYVLMGERNGFKYDDVWSYDFVADTWAFQPPANTLSDLARADHTSVVYGSHAYILGGRTVAGVTNAFLKYDLADRSWSAMPSPLGMAARFGHAAAVSGTKMTVTGGVLSDGSLSNEVWTYDFVSTVWTLVSPRKDNFLDNTAASAEFAVLVDAVAGPHTLPEPAFGGWAVAGGPAGNVYIGGGETMSSASSNLYKFDATAKSFNGMVAQPFARFDAAYTLVGGAANSQAIVMAGGDGKSVKDDAYTMWVGDDGVADVRA
ncbi:hypothetical protein PPROV_000591800 [Pycnococcus provasolii]|uniref:DUF2341 domain-containing protein n=1 Tax=Pycnococcus provasolii TaxID=41880 RepID=A0A830HIJ9_9CHLO|nr:hypothetical protein PPROV_000591800 [Pycnococcus provasolii]